jgi:hypothetical protein
LGKLQSSLFGKLHPLGNPFPQLSWLGIIDGGSSEGICFTEATAEGVRVVFDRFHPYGRDEDRKWKVQNRPEEIYLL